MKIRCQTVTFEGIEAIILDKDGTLENSLDFLRLLAQRRSRFVDAQIPGTGEPLLMAFGVQGETIDPRGLMAVGSREENRIAAAAYIAETGRSWSEALAIAQQAFQEADQSLPRRAEVSPLFAGTREILSQWAATGIKLGILSADSSAGVQSFIERHQLGEWIQLGMGVDPPQPSKPDPRLFQQVCEGLGVTPQQALMVGDSHLDIQMAKAAGAGGVIGICWGNAGAREIQQADVAIAHLNQLALAE
ncbi:HAD family hydrolase [Spirulina subsalsa]|uniref:HAD family hydrolase n=1 Tax=Spirulina subsalsa TaxID=54311 RepID=UPI0002F371FA|nr:HAD family hydrolase [Spirulina subsalsa]